MNTKGLDYTILTIAIIGAINWGLVGFFKLDLVNMIFGDMTIPESFMLSSDYAACILSAFTDVLQMP